MAVLRIITILLACSVGGVYCSSEKEDNKPSQVTKKKRKKIKKRRKKRTSADSSGTSSSSSSGRTRKDPRDDLSEAEKVIFDAFEANVAGKVKDACVGCHTTTELGGEKLSRANDVKNWQALSPLFADEEGRVEYCDADQIIVFLEGEEHSGAGTYNAGENKLTSAELKGWLDAEPKCIEKAAADAEAAALAAFTTNIAPTVRGNTCGGGGCHDAVRGNLTAFSRTGDAATDDPANYALFKNAFTGQNAFDCNLTTINNELFALNGAAHPGSNAVSEELGTAVAAWLNLEPVCIAKNNP